MSRLPESLSGLAAGLLFGVGLSVAQMTDPQKVLSFLDVLGGWDPSLALTMLGAVLVTSVGFRVVLHRGPVFGEKLHLPTRKDIDKRLITGAGLFGVGWGIAGYCPGPAIAAIAVNPAETVVFVASMIAGGMLHDAIGGVAGDSARKQVPGTAGEIDD